MLLSTLGNLLFSTLIFDFQIPSLWARQICRHLALKRNYESQKDDYGSWFKDILTIISLRKTEGTEINLGRV